MNVQVRLGSGLSHLVGNPRLTMTLAKEATVADLLSQLHDQYPILAPRLDAAIPMISGRHAAPSDSLQPGQEVALLLPVAGGAR